MKKTALLLTTALLFACKLHSMELPPEFTLQETTKRESICDEFNTKIPGIIANSLIDSDSSNKLFMELKKYSIQHTDEIEIFWKIHKELYISEAKAARDHARALVSLNSHLSHSQISPILWRTNVILGRLKDFEATIAKEKQKQALQKKN